MLISQILTGTAMHGRWLVPLPLIHSREACLISQDWMGLAFGLSGFPFSPHLQFPLFFGSLTLMSFPRQISFAIENGYPQCMLCDDHCLNFFMLVWYPNPPLLSSQSDADTALFVVLIGQALFPSFSFSFPAIYHHCFILISPFVVLSSSIVGIPDLLYILLLGINLIVNDIELRTKTYMGYKLQQKPSCTAGYRSTMETGNRPENNERWNKMV